MGCWERLSIKRSRASDFTRHLKSAHIPNHDAQLGVGRASGYSFLEHFWRVVGRYFWPLHHWQNGQHVTG